MSMSSLAVVEATRDEYVEQYILPSDSCLWNSCSISTIEPFPHLLSLPSL